jgi:hypothetical protein
LERLCEGDHLVEADPRPEKTVKLFKEVIERNCAHVKFTKTRGGTELGVRLDRNACDFGLADFEKGTGTVHVEGGLTLDYVKVRCIADIELGTLEGKGRLVKVESEAVDEHGIPGRANMCIFNPFGHPICFAYPLRIAPSTWLKHIPFGMFLVDILRPKVVVELGTYYGVSYCAFCQAVKELKIDAQCYAIDTWLGDPHGGYYGTEVLEDLKAHHDPLYSAFSRLIQSTFDEAVGHFADGSIDLLHIDGFHTYDSVAQDFRSWLPKMSRQGVMLFHDINVRESSFGVWRMWEELKLKYQSFEFSHEHGLGLLAVGEHYHGPLQKLLTSSEKDIVLIREFFSQLGSRMRIAEAGMLKRVVKEQSGSIKRLRALLKTMDIKVELQDPQIYEAYRGKYLISPTQIAIITNEDNRLMCLLPGYPKTELLPISDTHFFIENAEIEIMFGKDDEGRVNHLLLHFIDQDLKAIKFE